MFSLITDFVLIFSFDICEMYANVNVFACLERKQTVYLLFEEVCSFKSIYRTGDYNIIFKIKTNEQMDLNLYLDLLVLLWSGL